MVNCLDAMVNPRVYPEVNESRCNWDRDTKTTIHGLKSSLRSFGVIVGLSGLKNSLDVFVAYTMIENIKSEIQCLRDGIDVEFQRWYDEAKQLVSYIGTEEEMPRVPTVRCNLYYKRPFLLLISYCNICRTISLQTTVGQ